MTGDPVNEVQRWLKRQGYPLEMHVAHEFRLGGWEVIQSDYYEDPDSGQQRELDVSAHLQFDLTAPEPTRLFRLQVVVSCKLATRNPWVVFTAPHNTPESEGILRRPATKQGAALLARTTHPMFELALHSLPARLGYGITTAHVDQGKSAGKDAAYEASWSAIKAASCLASKFDSFAEKGDDIVMVFYPLVVVERLLLEAYLDEAAEVRVEPIERATLLWRERVADASRTVLHVVAHTALHQFVTDARAAYDTLRVEAGYYD